MAQKKKKIKKKLFKKRKKRRAPPDIIFDSTVGKTDALFVSKPEPAQESAQKPALLPQLDPAIAEALNEFDVLEKTQQTEPSINQPLTNQGDPEATPSIPKKNFWEKLFSLKNKLFLILIILVLAGLLFSAENPIKNIALGVSSGTWDFSKWIFGTPLNQATVGVIENTATLKSGLPADNTKFLIGGLLESIKNSEITERIRITKIEGSYGADKDIIVAGRAQKNSEIILSWNNQLGLTKADSNGKWIVNLGKMPEGKYNLQLVAKDSLQSSSIATAQISVSKKEEVNFFTASVSSLTQKVPDKLVLVSKDTPEVLQGKWDLMK